MLGSKHLGVDMERLLNEGLGLLISALIDIEAGHVGERGRERRRLCSERLLGNAPLSLKERLCFAESSLDPIEQAQLSERSRQVRMVGSKSLCLYRYGAFEQRLGL